ncbi:hypothetical protein MRB53_040769 [Persea americana]|nr:hypothetical protein MRB53_040769 [Persea americana]
MGLAEALAKRVRRGSESCCSPALGSQRTAFTKKLNVVRPSELATPDLSALQFAKLAGDEETEATASVFVVGLGTGLLESLKKYFHLILAQSAASVQHGDLEDVIDNALLVLSTQDDGLRRIDNLLCKIKGKSGAVIRPLKVGCVQRRYNRISALQDRTQGVAHLVTRHVDEVFALALVSKASSSRCDRRFSENFRCEMSVSQPWTVGHFAVSFDLWERGCQQPRLAP